MNELYTANIALSVFAMAIMLFSLRGDISQSKIRNLLCGGLYATIAICRQDHRTFACAANRAVRGLRHPSLPAESGA